jgi:hypothetical protein
LKRSAKILHFIAAATILVDALHQWRMHQGGSVLCITQAIIAIDIMILVFFTGEVLTEAPKMNILFRFIESMVLLGIAINLAFDGHGWFSLLHFIASFGYFFLLHREVRVIKRENVNICATGMCIA